MSKKYNVEVKFGTKWVTVYDSPLQNDAMHYIRENSGETYPMRIVRVVKTVVFEEKK